MSRLVECENKSKDDREIKRAIDLIFETMNFGEGIYFDEFKYICENITSELYYCIFDSIYHFVPCAQNFIYMLNNFMDVVTRAGFVPPEAKFLP